jgi:hypothetical protein
MLSTPGPKVQLKDNIGKRIDVQWFERMGKSKEKNGRVCVTIETA